MASGTFVFVLTLSESSCRRYRAVLNPARATPVVDGNQGCEKLDLIGLKLDLVEHRKEGQSMDGRLQENDGSEIEWEGRQRTGFGNNH